MIAILAGARGSRLRFLKTDGEDRLIIAPEHYVDLFLLAQAVPNAPTTLFANTLNHVDELWLRIAGNDCFVQFSFDNVNWTDPLVFPVTPAGIYFAVLPILVPFLMLASVAPAGSTAQVVWWTASN